MKTRKIKISKGYDLLSLSLSLSYPHHTRKETCHPYDLTM
jgi:hypothetical protein